MIIIFKGVLPPGPLIDSKLNLVKDKKHIIINSKLFDFFLNNYNIKYSEINTKIELFESKADILKIENKINKNLKTEKINKLYTQNNILNTDYSINDEQEENIQLTQRSK